MYEIDEETDKLGFTHNPFSMPQGGLEALNEKEPLDILAYQYDIVCNGVELYSGAVRNHDLDIMIKAFEIAGYTEEDYPKDIIEKYRAQAEKDAENGVESAQDGDVAYTTEVAVG